MRLVSCSLSLVLLTGGAASGLARSPDPNTASAPWVTRVPVSAAVASEARSLLETQAAAWNRGDLPAFCSVYAEDALFVTASGLTEGRAKVLARYEARYPDAAARGSLSFEVVTVDVLSPGAETEGTEAIAVVARWKITHAGRPAAEGLTLLNLVKGPAGWRIVHDASM